MIPIKEILSKITYTKFFGDINSFVKTPTILNIENNNPHALMWASEKNIARVKGIEYGTVVCSKAFSEFRPSCNYIICANPRLTFQEVLANFFVEEDEPHISSDASIHPTVKIGKNVSLGNNVIVEKNCLIGDGVKIDHNTVIKQGTEIYSNVKIGSNCTIGGVGFGYELNEQNKYVLIPHLGNVILKEHVEIGNNACIDRAVLGSTILEENVKVDNLVHIAHGVIIGKNSLIIANSMIGGSTTIGENVWVAPSVSILNKKTIANNSYIGMGSVVIKNVEANEIIVGNPGKVLIKSEKKS